MRDIIFGSFLHKMSHTFRKIKSIASEKVAGYLGQIVELLKRVTDF